MYLDKIFIKFPVFCRELCSRCSRFHPGEMHGTLEADCCGHCSWADPGPFQKASLPSAEAPQCQGAILGSPERSRMGTYLLSRPENSSDITSWMQVFSCRGAIAQLTTGREYLCVPWGAPSPHERRGRVEGCVRAVGDSTRALKRAGVLQLSKQLSTLRTFGAQFNPSPSKPMLT